MKTILFAVVAAVACATSETPKPAPAEAQAPAAAPAPKAAAPAPPQNPLFEKSSLPFEYPPFDKLHDADYTPAFEKGMADQRKEIDAIARDPSPPTFENTIVALEKSGALLTRASRAFFNLSQSNTDDEMEKIETDMAPKLAAHQDAILLDPALFARVDAVYQQRGKLGLDPESLQLVERYEDQFLRAGAKLSDADKSKLKQLNQDISTLTTKFRQNVLKSTKEGAVVVDDVKDLDGFSPQQIGAAAEAAKARKLEGKWVITLSNTTTQPSLEQLKSRALREKIFRASVSRSDGGGADNREVVSKIVTLRAQKAALLGYPNWATYELAEETAKTPQAVNDMLAKLSKAALSKAKQDAANIQRLIDAQAKQAHQKSFKLEPWDWTFYDEQVRKARFHFSDAEVKPYFEMGHVLEDGVFYAAKQLYGITFTERHDLPVYDKGVRVFDVRDADGSPLAIWIFDPFKRDNKQGGAWMSNYVDESTLLGKKPVVVNNLNIPKPAPGEPALLTFDDVTGMFHEFGHGLHGMFANTKYPLLSGTAVPQDFVEFPSQFNEMWAREPSILKHYAKDYKTGAPMPDDLFQKVLQTQTFDTGYLTSEYLFAAMLDQSWHQAPADQIPPADKVMAFEKAALQKDGIDYGPVPPRYHSLYFLHIFSSDDYSAGYYAYIWSEVLARDAGKWFHDHGGATRENGDVFRAKILSRGRTREPMVLFEDFYGGPPDVKPLLEYRGLADTRVSARK
ncbi:MAG: M3 family metallopeptidase [Myxococcales bacterium]|nr:M3 family metallopeptidase [Myxococcales bacterium]